MENIKFEITEEDIKEYLNEHKEEYKYKEALFIKFLKENRFNLTKESLQILLTKNKSFLDGEQLNIDTYNNLPFFSTKSFSSLYIKDLNLSGICHILIPTIKYYDGGISGVTTGRLYVDLNRVAEKLNIPMEKPWDILESTLDDYRICGKIEKTDKFITFKFGREHSRCELVTYSQFYDEDKVKKVRKIVREGMNKHVQGIR